jgi:hypothetical protein
MIMLLAAMATAGYAQTGGMTADQMKMMSEHMKAGHSARAPAPARRSGRSMRALEAEGPADERQARSYGDALPPRA